MRTPLFSLLATLIVVAAIALLAGVHPDASARLQTDGTPAATPAGDATPVADEEPTEEPEDTGIVILVLWYQQNESGEILQLMPIESDGVLATRGEPENDEQRGRIVFDESRNDGFPRIRVGDENYFDAYPIYPDDPASVQRWFYFDDDPTLRPATMVMQIEGIRGEYDGWFGTATFISRGTDQGGVVVIAVNPPDE